jgi:beta-phosphoglucomutase-like phosphatase (HAD superfamily)
VTSLSPRPRAVLFDVDGTLVDTNALHAVAWREAFRHFGHEVPLETIRTQIGKGGDNLIPTLLPGLPEAARAEIDAWRGDLFKRDYLPSAVPFPAVRALFERLTQDEIRIVLASSSSKEEVRFHLDLIAGEDLVAAITSKDDVESSKPCPDIFEAALAKVAPIPAEQVLVVGDSPWDMKAAARAGLKPVGFLCGGFAEPELRAEGAIACYRDAAHLLAEYDGSPFAHHG